MYFGLCFLVFEEEKKREKIREEDCFEGFVVFWKIVFFVVFYL